MKQEGFDIETVTIQNEPLNRGNSASLYMTWQEQRDFIKVALGPAFENPDKTYSIVFQNDINEPINLTVKIGGKSFTYNLLQKSVNSFIWNK